MNGVSKGIIMRTPTRHLVYLDVKVIFVIIKRLSRQSKFKKKVSVR